MYYKTKANKIGNASLATVGVRVIETVEKSGVPEAKESNQYLLLLDVNARYQTAIVPGNDKQVNAAITAKYNQRYDLFMQTHKYLEGLLCGPDIEMGAAASLLFESINMYGTNYRKYKIADQSIYYSHIIDAMMSANNALAVEKTILTERLGLLDQTHQEYEELYMGRGNASGTKVAPSSLRKEMESAIKLYLDEVKFMSARIGTENWKTLSANLKKRFDEVNVSATSKQSVAKDSKATSTTTEK